MSNKVVWLDFHVHAGNRKKLFDYWVKARKKGLNGFAVTEHADNHPKESFQKLLECKPADMVLIPGIELNTNLGNVLVYADSERLFEVEKWMEKNIQLDEVLEIAKEWNFLVAFSHPYGYNKNSAAYKLKPTRLLALVRQENIGVEAFNGLLGELSNFVLDSGFTKVPLKLLELVEKNWVLKKTPLEKISFHLRSTILHDIDEVVMRSSAALELGNNAKFIVAGSGGHYPDSLGAGVVKLQLNSDDGSIKNILRALKDKDNVLYAGPLMMEDELGVFHKVEKGLNQQELNQAIAKMVAKEWKKRFKTKPIKINWKRQGEKWGGSVKILLERMPKLPKMKKKERKEKEPKPTAVEEKNNLNQKEENLKKKGWKKFSIKFPARKKKQPIENEKKQLMEGGKND